MSQSQTQRSSRVDLLHGSILKSLLLFALPIMASRVFQQILQHDGHTDCRPYTRRFVDCSYGCLLVDL